ncbi:MAG: HTH domain-containing protein [Clostridia bacterium]|nr:HTH domain-containing protein [Clostridia bacterium]
MKKTWTLTYESIPGNGVQKVTFKSFDDVKRTVREMISHIGVQHYTYEIRDGINIPYREAMARFIEGYVSREDFFRVGDALPSDDIADYPYEPEKIKNDSDMYVDDDWYDEDEETDELNDFNITIREDYLVFECYGDELSLRTNMVVMDNDEEFYEFKFFAERAPKNRFRELTIELELTLNQRWGTSAYPVLILKTLQNSNENLNQQEIATRTAIERKAVGRNIALLKEIGYDIRHDGRGYYIPKKTSALEQNDFQTIVESINRNDTLDDDRKRELIDKLFEM